MPHSKNPEAITINVARLGEGNFPQALAAQIAQDVQDLQPGEMTYKPL